MSDISAVYLKTQIRIVDISNMMNINILYMYTLSDIDLFIEQHGSQNFGITKACV